MFVRLVGYRLKVLVRNRSLLFWTLAFPIILGCLFNVTFGGLDNDDRLEPTTVGIVSEDKNKTDAFEEVLTNVKSGDLSMFKGKELSQKEAEKQLKEDNIAGYFVVTESEPTLFVNKDGISQTMLKEFLNQYVQQTDKYTTILALQGIVVNDNYTQTNYVTEKESYGEIKYKSFYFFTLVAMMIMYGFMWGLLNANVQQANQSSEGIRLCLIPENKLLVSLANITATYIVLLFINLFTLGFFRFVYDVDFGDRWGYIILLYALSSMMTLLFGTLIGNYFTKFTFNQKNSFGIAITTIMSFFAGMMGTPNVKYWIDVHVPLLGKINLVNLISDSLYQLSYYRSLSSFYQSLLWIIGFIVLFILLNYNYEKKVQYDYL